LPEESAFAFPEHDPLFQHRRYATTRRSKVGYRKRTLNPESRLLGIPQLCEPILQGLLMRLLYGPESNAHSVRPRVGHFPKSYESGSSMVNSYPHLRPPGKGRRRLNKTSEHAQIASHRSDLPFRFDVHDFHPSCKRAPHRAMLLYLHKLEYEPLSSASLSIPRQCVLFLT